MVAVLRQRTDEMYQNMMPGHICSRIGFASGFVEVTSLEVVVTFQ